MADLSQLFSNPMALGLTLLIFAAVVYLLQPGVLITMPLPETFTKEHVDMVHSLVTAAALVVIIFMFGKSLGVPIAPTSAFGR